ncbi:MAG: hypothetical protein K2I70_01215, partial [Bacilli bacterium]|nr:hypothetical protein [Bacilli bacterium]
IIFLAILLLPLNINALTIGNRVLTENEYTNLVNLGFDDVSISMMSDEEFYANKDLEAEIVAQDSVYFRTYVYAKNQITMRYYDEEDDDYYYVNEEITKEEYENSDRQSVMPLDTSNPVDTTYKNLVTTLSYVSSTKRYRANSTLKWKKMPKTRSYDIFAMSVNPSVSEVLMNSQHAYSTYEIKDYCRNKTVSSNKMNHDSDTWRKNANGTGVTFKLPESWAESFRWDETKNIPYPCENTINKIGKMGNVLIDYDAINLQSILYFDLVKVSKAPLSVYGDYQHAQKSVSLSAAANFSISFDKGNLGPSISISSTTSEKYDHMSSTHIQILNPKW